jgi:type IV secretion system protein TrbF
MIGFSKLKEKFKKKEGENPYVSARRTWNSTLASMASSASAWQTACLLCLLITLASIGGLIHVGSQSKFIPYVVEVDRLGQSQAAGPINPTPRSDPRVIHREVTDFIIDARTVTPDVALQRNAIYKVYAKLSPNDPGTEKMNQWLNGTEDSSPFKRATKEIVSVEIRTAMQQTNDTWQVDWIETKRDRNGSITGVQDMRALVTVYLAETSRRTTEEDMRKNPINLYIRDFSWSRLSN